MHTASDGGMITNIIDCRKRQHRWKLVDAIIESTWHDNGCLDSDQAERDDREPGYAARKNVSVAEAVEWAASFEVPLTLYLYDEGSDSVPDLPAPHFL
jgi:hypothetical protein